MEEKDCRNCASSMVCRIRDSYIEAFDRHSATQFWGNKSLSSKAWKELTKYLAKDCQQYTAHKPQ